MIIYEPWAVEMRKLALNAQALSWDMGKINREVAHKAYLFPEIPEEDKERYLFRTKMVHIPGVGYKPRGPVTIARWLTDEMMIGWWMPNADKPDTITDHHDAILDYPLFAEGYAAITGYTLEGEPVENYRGVTLIRNNAPDVLFHGRITIPPPSPKRTTFIVIDDGNYVARSRQENGILVDKLFTFPIVAFDNVVIDRLKVLESADRKMNLRVKEALDAIHNQQSEDFVSIYEQLKGIEAQLAENAEKRLDTSKKDPLYGKLQNQADGLLTIKEHLAVKKDKLGLIDGEDEIAQLHSLLKNFDVVWPTFDLDQRQRAFTLLVKRIEVVQVSPHWLRLAIDWLDAVSARIDVAYVWKVSPAHPGELYGWEAEMLRQYYPTAPRSEILKLLPDRTWQSLHRYASVNGIRRENPAMDAIPHDVSYCYRDFEPKLDGEYLFGDYETTLQYITIANANTSKKGNVLYPIWLAWENTDLFKRALN